MKTGASKRQTNEMKTSESLDNEECALEDPLLSETWEMDSNNDKVPDLSTREQAVCLVQQQSTQQQIGGNNEGEKLLPNVPVSVERRSNVEFEDGHVPEENYCALCQNFVEDYRIHIQSKQHMQKCIERRMKELPEKFASCGQEVSATTPVQLGNGFVAPTPIPVSNSVQSYNPVQNDYQIQQNRYYCNVCSISCSGMENLAQHYASKRHLKKTEEHKVIQSLQTMSLAEPSKNSASHNFQLEQEPKEELRIQEDQAVYILNMIYSFCFSTQPQFVSKATGPQHRQHFFVTLTLPAPISKSLSGEGCSLKEARKNASLEAIRFLYKARVFNKNLIPAAYLLPQ